MDRIITPTKIINLNERGKTSLVSARLDREIMVSDIAYYKINSTEKLDLKINDYVEIFGKKYKINKRPTEKKLSKSAYVYDVEFEGLMYELSKAKFFNTDATGFKTTSSFSLTGTIETFLIVIKNNLQRISTKWEIGHFVNGETKTISFSKDDCFSAMQKICDEFKVEFVTVEINNKFYVHTGNFGTEYPYVFEYGKGKGLYDLQLQSADDKSIVTRVFVEGGTQNLPEGYRNYSTNLKLPDNAEYLEDTELIAKYGVIEGFLDFPEIYPHRTGVVSAIFTDNVLKFSDSTMDFDLNEKETDGVTTKYLISGTTAKVHFNTGNLAGYQFDIKKYDHATKTFEINPFTNEEKLVFPSSTFDAFKIQEVDEYVLIDIYMPESYLTNAEAELLATAIPEFEKLKEVKVKYDINIDKEFLNIKKTLPFNVGDKLRVKDLEMAVDKFIRINAISYDLIEKNLKVTLADSYEMGTIRQLNFEVTKLDVKTSVKTQQTIIQEQRIKDVEIKTNFLEETNVSGNVIATGLLMVGDENGANAGISGITDLEEKSVRLFAGSTATERNTANWKMRDDGVEEQRFGGILVRERGIINGNYSDILYNLNGKIAKKTSIVNGKIIEQWFNDGVLVYEVGQNGIYYVAEIPESFTTYILVNLNRNDDTTDFSIFHNLIRGFMWQKTSNPQIFELRGNKTAYQYNAGQNVYSVSNKTYEGFKNTQDKIDNIADGWYCYQQLGDMMTDGVSETKKEVELLKISSGKPIVSVITLVETDGYIFNQF